MSNTTVLVTGSTGKQGFAVARLLLQRGHTVRALARDGDSSDARTLAKLGAELVVGDFDDPASLRSAAAGVTALFAMATPFEAGIDAEIHQGKAVIDAARHAEVGHLVYSSVASADQNSGVPHFESKHHIEKYLAESRLPHTILAPTAFFENLLGPWALDTLRAGRVVEPLASDIPVQRVAVADIASFACMVLDAPERFTGQRIELASASVTGAEIAAVLSRHAGRPVRYDEMPRDQANALGADFVRMYDFFARGGYVVDIPALHQAYPRIGWHSFEGWAAEQEISTRLRL